VARTYKTPNFEPGQKVAYSVQFLRSIGMSHGDMAHARGIVREVKAHTPTLVLVSIDWTSSKVELPERVNAVNLAIVGANPRFANVD
jgi:hypothetical protein